MLLLLSLVACVDVHVPGEDDPSWQGWDDGPTTPRVEVRVATWNVESLGEVDSVAYEAVVSVLRRMDADVVLLQEVADSESSTLSELASDAGYSDVGMYPYVPYGDIGNAVLSRLPRVSLDFPTSAALSGDAGADDQTRLPVALTAEIPGTELRLRAVGLHLKSGFDASDVFRRNVDALRAAQALDGGADLTVVGGDFNEELGLVPGLFSPFTTLPAGLPGDYALGDDVQERVDGAGLVDDPFQPFRDAGLSVVEARQRDGSATTRPTSGRRLDHVFVDAAAASASLRSEVYDSADESIGGLADAGAPLSYNLSGLAADHLPVLISLRVAAP